MKSTNGSIPLLPSSATSAHISPIHTVGQTIPGNGCTTRKKLLLIFVLIQLVVMSIMQWKFGGILGIVTWNTNTTPRTFSHSPMDFLGTHVDIHQEDPQLGHTWEEDDDVSEEVNVKDIAIGLAITSSKLYRKVETARWPFFKQLMPSFCKTASSGYNYHFFLAYDYVDKFFTNSKLLEGFVKQFRQFTEKHCRNSSTYLIHFVQCSHTGKPANAQNDAMMAAYMLNMGYYYRINDDTVMNTGKWTELFIEALNGYQPTNVGVVGPNHKNGNTAILTYDFVSVHHVAIFGCYYPHVFTDWWGDSWMSEVYKPGRVTKLKSVGLVHTLAVGQRYRVHQEVKSHLKAEVAAGKSQVTRYVAALERNQQQKLTPDPSKVIAMTLYGNVPKYTYGAIRNAQLMPVFFPDWTLQIYIDKSSNPRMSKMNMSSLTRTTVMYPNSTAYVMHNSSLRANLSSTLETFKATAFTVPWLVLNKLQTLGAKIILVDMAKVAAPSLWRYLALDDVTTDMVLIRDPAGRITSRDQKLVNDWMSNDTTSFMYASEMGSPLPYSSNIAIRRNKLRLTQSLQEFAKSVSQKQKTVATEKQFYLDVLSKGNNRTCYDSLHCEEDDYRLFPTRAQAKGECFGQKYNIYDTPLLKLPTAKSQCYVQSAPNV